MQESKISLSMNFIYNLATLIGIMRKQVLKDMLVFPLAQHIQHVVDVIMLLAIVLTILFSIRKGKENRLRN